MKNIKTTKMVALLACLCLVTACFVGGTLAKYTTNGTGSDSARVAKFGVTVTATSDSMFDAEYDADASDYTGLTVQATENVVAPGTEGTLTKVTLSGKPEVAVRVTNDADLTLTGWEVNGAEYCPIVITVGTDEYKMTGTIAEFEEAVEEAIEAYTADYAPGTDLSAKTDACPVVSWAWAFETGTDDDAKTANNAKDTALGNAGAAKIALDITTTVTQID